MCYSYSKRQLQSSTDVRYHWDFEASRFQWRGPICSHSNISYNTTVVCRENWLEMSIYELDHDTSTTIRRIYLSYYLVSVLIAISKKKAESVKTCCNCKDESYDGRTLLTCEGFQSIGVESMGRGRILRVVGGSVLTLRGNYNWLFNLCARASMSRGFTPNSRARS